MRSRKRLGMIGGVSKMTLRREVDKVFYRRRSVWGMKKMHKQIFEREHFKEKLDIIKMR